MISLLMVQSSLLMGGYLCVNYASYCAARSAIVYIPQEMREESRNQLLDYERHTESDWSLISQVSPSRSVILRYPIASISDTKASLGTDSAICNLRAPINNQQSSLPKQPSPSPHHPFTLPPHPTGASTVPSFVRKLNIKILLNVILIPAALSASRACDAR